MIRLKELREAIGKTQRELAKEFNVSKSAYNYWENGVMETDYQKLHEMAKYFDVSIDYLLGYSDYYYPDRVALKEVSSPDGDKIERLTPKENELLLLFRKIGEDFSQETQDAALNILKNMSTKN